MVVRAYGWWSVEGLEALSQLLRLFARHAGPAVVHWVAVVEPSYRTHSETV